MKKYIITKLNGKRVVGDGKDILDIIEQKDKVLIVSEELEIITIEIIPEL